MQKRTRLSRELLGRDDKLNHCFAKAPEMCDCTSLIQRENVKSLPACTKKEIDSFLPEKRITIIYLFLQLVVTVHVCFVASITLQCYLNAISFLF